MLIVALALRHFYVSDRWAAQVEANARAEADALQARIRPHFLFNSMNLIAGLLRRDPAVARLVYNQVLAERERRFSGGAAYKDSSRHYYEIAHQDYLESLQRVLGDLAESGPALTLHSPAASEPKQVA